jgi:hypothetical protein
MYFDPSQNAYVDKETGEVVFVEETTPHRTPMHQQVTPPSKQHSLRNPSSGHDDFYGIGGNTIVQPTNSHNQIPGHDIEAERFERLFELAVLENQRSVHSSHHPLEQDLYDLHVSNAYEIASPPRDVNQPRSVWDDWNLARTLQVN